MEAIKRETGKEVMVPRIGREELYKRYGIPMADVIDIRRGEEK